MQIKVPHRRRREGKTDYRKRLEILKSGKIRFVIRKSLSHTSVQAVAYEKNGDKILASAHSSELKKFGWTFGCGNTPAAYLTGLLAGKRALAKAIKEGVLDLGLQKSVRGSRLYAALKGVIDAGVSVPHDPEMLPPENRISGEHIQNYLKREIVKNFSDVKNKIMNEKV
jgi:large subunit ribosomal protein L18